MKWIWVALLAGACSDDDDVPAFEPSCVEIPWSNPDAYKTAAELGGEPVPGTLARWNPAERYFFTGVYIGNPVRRIDEQLGVSSVRLEVVDGGLLVDGAVPGTLDESQGFYTRDEAFPDGSIRRSSMRISNRASDGSLRADRAVCDGKNCRVCTARLERAKHVDNKPSNRLTLVGELADPTWGPGFTYNVRVAGTMAYLVRDDGLHVIDVADPANPVERGRFPQTGKGRSNDVKIVDAAGGRRYAIIADSPVVIVDVTNPEAPTQAAQLTEEAHTVFTETRAGATYAYFGNLDGKTPVYDVTDPAQPRRLGGFDARASYVHDLSVENGIAYLNAWEKGLVVVDYTDPAKPKYVGSSGPTATRASHSNWTTRAGGRHIVLTGDESYGAHLDILEADATSPAFLLPISSYKTRDHVSIHNIMAFGTKAYVTYYQDGVRVLDVSDPARPKLVGHYNTWDPNAPTSTSAFFEGAVGLDVDLERKLVFVADSPRGLLVLRDDT